MKYTHKVMLVKEHNEGAYFYCTVKGRTVYVTSIIKQDGSEHGFDYSYEADGEGVLTPELWFNDVTRWKVEKLNKFKGNK